MSSSLHYYALFPYLTDATEWFKTFLRENNLSISELIDDKVIEGGLRRVKASLARWDWRKVDTFNFIAFFHPDNLEVTITEFLRRRSAEFLVREYLSYFVSTLILAQIRDRWAKRRFAIFESKRFTHIMENIIKPRLMGDKGGGYTEVLETIAHNLGMMVDLETVELKAHFQDPSEGRLTLERIIPTVPLEVFLKAAPSRIGSWKLINHIIKRGKVWILYDHEFTRLVEHFVSNKVLEDVSSLESKANEGLLQLPDKIKEAAESVSVEIAFMRAKLNREIVGEEESFPPCMRKIMAEIRSGANITHQGRFAITTFLHKLGWNEERILELMRNFPDFDERLATYQIRHILGRISGKMYEVPSCDTMRSYGLCFPDTLCKKVRHPLQYVRIASRSSKKTLKDQKKMKK